MTGHRGNYDGHATAATQNPNDLDLLKKVGTNDFLTLKKLASPLFDPEKTVLLASPLSSVPSPLSSTSKTQAKAKIIFVPGREDPAGEDRWLWGRLLLFELSHMTDQQPNLRARQLFTKCRHLTLAASHD